MRKFEKFYVIINVVVVITLWRLCYVVRVWNVMIFFVYTFLKGY